MGEDGQGGSASVGGVWGHCVTALRQVWGEAWVEGFDDWSRVGSRFRGGDEFW